MAVAVEQLSSIPLFTELDEQALSRVAHWFDERIYHPGDAVVRAGSAGYAFYVLVSGSLSVLVSDQKVRQLAPGDFFGEISIIGDGRRSATVTADNEATVLEMFGAQFRELQMELPDVAAMIEKAMAERTARDSGS